MSGLAYSKVFSPVGGWCTPYWVYFAYYMHTSGILVARVNIHKLKSSNMEWYREIQFQNCTQNSVKKSGDTILDHLWVWLQDTNIVIWYSILPVLVQKYVGWRICISGLHIQSHKGCVRHVKRYLVGMTRRLRSSCIAVVMVGDRALQGCLPAHPDVPQG